MSGFNVVDFESLSAEAKAKCVEAEFAQAIEAKSLERFDAHLEWCVERGLYPIEAYRKFEELGLAAKRQMYAVCILVCSYASASAREYAITLLSD